MDTKTVLIVEDEQNIRRLIKVNLELEGFNVLEARNGREGLQMVEKHRPDIVVTDIMMPEMDGVQFYLSLKEMPEGEAIPVVVLTAKDQFEDIKYATLLGVDEYLIKPFNPDDLVSRIRGMI